MLTLYEYILLNNSQRGELLLSDGELLSNVITDEALYSLYSLFDYYVEVSTLENEIVEITPFKTGDRLEKYLSEINIADL